MVSDEKSATNHIKQFLRMLRAILLIALKICPIVGFQYFDYDMAWEGCPLCLLGLGTVQPLVIQMFFPFHPLPPLSGIPITCTLDY
jgi:hypothetical protein